ALSQYRFLLGHHPQGDGLPDHDVHRVVRCGAYGRLDFAVEGNDRGSAPEDRPSAPALHRRHPTRLRTDLAQEVITRPIVVAQSRSEMPTRHGRMARYRFEENGPSLTPV